MQTHTDNVIDNAIVEVKSGNELVTIDPAKYAAAAFEPYKKDLASAKRAASKAGQFDITTTAGMKQAKELRASFRAVRTGIENARKEAKAPVIEAGKKIDEVAKEMTADVVPHETKYDEMIRLEEKRKEDEKQAAIAAERARIEAIEAKLAHLRGIPAQFAQADSITIQQQIDALVQQRLNPADYEEFLDDAIYAQTLAIEHLKQHHAAALEREAEARRVAAERAELARLQAMERERQEKAAAAEKAQAEAAAAIAKQQAQMNDIMGMQGLAAALEAAGQHQDREHLAAAIAKARAFDPGTFGAMAPMAKLARDAALGLLEDMLAKLPPDESALVDMLQGDIELDKKIEDQPVDATSPVISDTAPIESAAGEVIGKVVIVDAPRKVIPPAKRPSDLDITQALAERFDVTSFEVLKWIISFDIGAVREQLEAM